MSGSGSPRFKLFHFELRCARRNNVGVGFKSPTRARKTSLEDFSTMVNRRQFLRALPPLVVGGSALVPGAFAKDVVAEPILDIHQHLNYSGRDDVAFLKHQRAMGITRTILLPAGHPVNSPSTHEGTSNGLEAKCAANEECLQFVRQNPGEFYFGSNEVPDQPEAIRELEKYLKAGAVVIGEQKFGLECDAPAMQRVYDLAAEYRVPILMHWQFKRYNYGFERFHRILAKFPKTIFIGHAQTWWANIDREYQDDDHNLYPKGKITPGGLTDKYLSDYPNMYGDLSAGSGLNALTRDEDHARAFIRRHQDKLIFGSDCSDLAGAGSACQGSQTIAALRRLAPSKAIERKLLYENGRKLFRI